MTAIARGRGAQDRLLRTAARGAALIGVAVVIGIVLLQVVDEGPSIGGPPSSGGPNRTTTSTAALQPPQAIKVLVFNGSGLAGDATNTANTLKSLGYQVIGAVNAPKTQTGTTVACRAGFEGEAAALAKAVDPAGGATVVGFPNPAPTGSEGAICLVTTGK